MKAIFPPMNVTTQGKMPMPCPKGDSDNTIKSSRHTWHDASKLTSKVMELYKVVMELGGNAPCMVEDLVPDLEGTIAKLVHKGFYQSGQSCIHMQRLYVKGEVSNTHL
ncbi:hypothetical protein SELMODRAFT_432180 [Selaginella moellendorffii]|uniref:NADP-dependent glyceraldehyde-3-phosphate dehydrogenase n=1 Tax=Selaginella moellendorffii TaxID=88036 RepID=D8TF82_SELML|nr:hypothetical protein SELMODRAFT_432180 [Selaginella moellendorffii]